MKVPIFPFVAKKYLSVCYFPNWSPLKNVSSARLGVAGINPNLCSHLMYAFVMIDSNIEIFPTEPDDLKGNYKAFNDLKMGHDTVTMLSVGGQLNSERGFQLASYTEETRRKFARNIINYVRKYGFDGIDIDWEYPRPSEKHLFTLLLKVSVWITFCFICVNYIHCSLVHFFRFILFLLIDAACSVSIHGVLYNRPTHSAT